MNLITESWIPITRQDGAHGLVSLDELFAGAAEIRDLAVRPPERIALLRLLICIAQAALDGPEDHSAWENCRDQIPDRARAYLHKWKAQFELLGDGPRFLQVPNLKSDKEDAGGTAATKLDLALATGHNATIFDNAGGSERPMTPARLALALLTFQCLSPCTIIGAVSWAGQAIPKCTGKHAPAASASMLHCYLTGERVLETIWLNLLDKERVTDSAGPDGWGVPVWENLPATLNSNEAVRNATSTYLGRLTPISRLIRLHDDRTHITLGNGLDYPLFPAFREAAATVIERKEKPTILGAELGRDLWRQLPAVVVKRRYDQDRMSGPLTLDNLPPDSPATLWLGALVTHQNNKILDVISAAYEVPSGMFQDTGRQVYEAGVAYADGWESGLARSVKAFAAALKLDRPPGEKARHHFWTAIEQHVPALLALINSPALAADFSTTAWGGAVRAAAQEAYEFACPRQNPRQIEAFAKGRHQLFPRHASPKSDGQNKAVKTKPTRKP